MHWTIGLTGYVGPGPLR